MTAAERADRDPLTEIEVEAARGIAVYARHATLSPVQQHVMQEIGRRGEHADERLIGLLGLEPGVFTNAEAADLMNVCDHVRRCRKDHDKIVTRAIELVAERDALQVRVKQLEAQAAYLEEVNVTLLHRRPLKMGE